MYIYQFHKDVFSLASWGSFSLCGHTMRVNMYTTFSIMSSQFMSDEFVRDRSL